MVSTLAPSAETRHFLDVRGGNAEFCAARDKEIVVEGPAGTGKTRTILEFLHLLCRTIKMRGLITRHHGVTLTTTALVTFNQKVLEPQDGVKFFGGNKHEPAAYRYSNGSEIVVGGLDDAEKILSSEYDFIYVNEATEINEDTWEKLTTRLRNGGLRYQRLVGDCNPTADKHWLNKRATEGKTRRIKTYLEDNPAYYNEDGTTTPEGAEYVATLDRLTGARYKRFRLGLWAGVENAAYPHFDRTVHIRPLEQGLVFRRNVAGVDYGRVHQAASYVLSQDQYGRVWVREGWAEADTQHGKMTIAEVGRQRRQYSITQVGVDPNQDVLLGAIMPTEGGLADGARNTRIDLTATLMNLWPGGQVPWPLSLQLTPRTDYMAPTTRPDTPGLILVEGAPGIDELADEIESYHYVERETDTKKDKVIARIDDNRIAAVEYGIWAMQNLPFMDPADLFGRVGVNRG